MDGNKKKKGTNVECCRDERIGFLVCAVAAFAIKSVDCVHGPPVIVPPYDATSSLCLTVLYCAFLVLESWSGGWVLGRDWIDNGDVWENKMGSSESFCIVVDVLVVQRE